MITPDDETELRQTLHTMIDQLVMGLMLGDKRKVNRHVEEIGRFSYIYLMLNDLQEEKTA